MSLIIAKNRDSECRGAELTKPDEPDSPFAARHGAIPFRRNAPFQSPRDDFLKTVRQWAPSARRSGQPSTRLRANQNGRKGWPGMGEKQADPWRYSPSG